MNKFKRWWLTLPHKNDMFFVRIRKAVQTIYEATYINDPVKSCEIYKTRGCSHVDGITCDMKTCKELKEHRFIGEYVKTAEFKFYNQEHFGQYKMNDDGVVEYTPDDSTFIPFEEFEDDE